MEELKKCPLCESDNFEFIMSAKDYFASKKEFNIVKCKDCELRFTNPRPDKNEMKAFYDAKEYISHEDLNNSFFDKVYQKVKKRMIKKKIKLIKSLFTKKQINVLDFGCGTGDFLVEAKKKNCWGIGVESNSNARNRALSKGIKVVGEMEKAANLPKQAFDVITFWHSLEHTHDFKNTLDKLSTLLKPNGVFIIAIPEHRSYDAKVYKKFWAAYDLPRHLYHFEEKTLKKCLPDGNFMPFIKKGLLFDSYYISLLSEKYKKRNKFFMFLCGVLIGFISNCKAKRKKYPYSSQLYVFRKLN